MSQESEFFRVPSGAPIFNGEFSSLEAPVSESDQVEQRQRVAILMATYNGTLFLNEQLASIEQQAHQNWALYVSDDGSQDDTVEILEAARQRWGGGRLKWLEGPRQGYVANFLSLTCSVDINADFYAWSDQDDIWCADKLEVAVAWLNTVPEHTPALYCGRAELIYECGTHMGVSPLFVRPPNFVNALVQNIAGGNTMVFNQAARELLQEAGANQAVPSHDWWAYQLISGAGGVIYYDPQPKILYRQHDGNLVGSNISWAARLIRMRMVFEGRFKSWNQQTVDALESMQHRLTEEHKIALKHFKQARNETLILRIFGCFRAGIYRQTLFGNLGLALAILLKKI